MLTCHNSKLITGKPLRHDWLRIVYRCMVDSHETSTFDILTHTSGKNCYIHLPTGICDLAERDGGVPIYSAVDDVTQLKRFAV